MKLSVIIPNFNGERLLKENLPKVRESLNAFQNDFEIIIVDDKSTDKSIEAVSDFINKNQRDEIRLLLNPKNLGFSSTVNKGVENARGELIVLLNTDVIPSENFLKKIIPHFKKKDVFAVGCMDESIEGNNIIKRGRGKGKWSRGLLVHSAALIESGDTLWVSGGSGVFRKKVWDELGGLDIIYNPFYWEDIDISYRARKAGFKTLFEKESVVRHEHESGSIKTKYSSEKIKKIAYRNQFIFAWKNSDFGTLTFGLIWIPYHLLRGALSRNTAMLTGFIDAVNRLPKIIKSRRKNKAIFSLTDKQVTSNI